jgi:hypothetical protein
MSVESERVQKIHLQKRLEKAIEYKTSLKNANIIESEIQGLQEFSVILNTWVKEGSYVKDKIKLPEIDKQLEYQLSTPKFTYIRLRTM